MDDQQRWSGQQEPGAPQRPGPPPPPGYAPTVGHRQPPGPERRNIVIGVAATVVAVALIAGGIWVFAADDDDDTPVAVGNTASANSDPVPTPSAPTASSARSGGATPTATGKPGSKSPGASASASVSAPAFPAGNAKCEPKEGAPTPMTFPSAPPMSIDKNAAYEMTLATSCGPVAVRLEAAKAPVTVNSFNFLAGKNYFDHTPCHRLTTAGIYVLQCGDPTGTGSGGPGYKFADENLTGATYPAGTVAMANAGPGTNGSQFFVVYKDSQLPASYTPFGTVTAGLDVVRAIAADGVWDESSDGAPKALVVLDDLTVTRK